MTEPSNARRLVSPVLRSARSGPASAPRLETLDGVVLGLLSNGKVNGNELLDLAVEELSRRWSIAGTVSVTKAHPSLPPAEADVELLAEQTLAVLSAVGD